MGKDSCHSNKGKNVMLKMRMGKLVTSLVMQPGQEPFHQILDTARGFQEQGLQVIWARNRRSFDVLYETNHICNVWVD